MPNTVKPSQVPFQSLCEEMLKKNVKLVKSKCSQPKYLQFFGTQLDKQRFTEYSKPYS